MKHVKWITTNHSKSCFQPKLILRIKWESNDLAEQVLVPFGSSERYIDEKRLQLVKRTGVIFHHKSKRHLFFLFFFWDDQEKLLELGFNLSAIFTRYCTFGLPFFTNIILMTKLKFHRKLQTTPRANLLLECYARKVLEDRGEKDKYVIQ